LTRGPIKPDRLQRMRWVLERRQLDLELVIDNVWDAHNVAAIMRTADGFGVGAMSFLYWYEVFPRISVGVSGFSKRWTRVRQYKEPAPCFAELKERGFTIYATTVDGAVPYDSVDWTKPSAIVMGHERDGCSEQVLAGVDARVSMPMEGFVQSYNVSVSAGIVLSEVARQRRLAKRYEPSWDDRRQAILERWIEREETGLPREP
jgi:tRNA (guanosine-2'-O-)-methyltransferase